MTVAVISLALWLVAAQAFAAQVCCSEMPSPGRKAACDGCGTEGERESSPRPDCCASFEPQKDIELAVPRTEISQTPIAVDVLSEEGTFAPWHPESADLIADVIASRAESPPLYLRYEVLLI